MKKNITSLLNRPIAFHPILAKAFGGIQEAIFWQQIHYWSDKGGRVDGFIYKTKEDIEKETTLTRCQQDKARKKLVKLGVVSVKKLKANGSPTLHYKINIDEVFRLVENLLMEKQETDVSEKQETDVSITETTQRLPESTTESCVAVTTPAQEAELFFSGVMAMQQGAPAEDTKKLLMIIMAKTGMDRRRLWDEVQAFTNYWTEREKNGKRQRWHIEKTFEVDKRLGTWLRRSGTTFNRAQPIKSKYKAGVV